MPTYAVLPPTDGTTLHARERRFASELCDQILYLSPDGLRRDHGDGLDDVDLTQLANAVYKSTRNLDWTEADDLYVLVDTDLLDRETDNRFRRSLRVLFRRVAPQATFPYDHLEDAGRKAGWLTDSLDAGEIVHPKGVHRRSVSGVDESQTDVHSF